MKDIKPIFNWAEQNGDANIYDRILIKIMPQLFNENVNLTAEIISSNDNIEVSSELYNLVKSKTEELIGSSYEE